MRNIRAGALRNRVYLGQPVITLDNAGGESLTWDELECWANIDGIKGNEFANAIAVKDAVDCVITIRTIPNWMPDARWRIRDKQSSKIWNVVSVLNRDKFGSVEVLARSVQGDSDGR